MKHASIILMVLAASALCYAVAWTIVDRWPKVTVVSLKPKAAMHIVVPPDERDEFIVLMKTTAAASGFFVKYNLSDSILPSGRRIIYFVFVRSDGIEINLANPFHIDDVYFGIYDERDVGCWRPIYDLFVNTFEKKFLIRRKTVD